MHQNQCLYRLTASFRDIVDEHFSLKGSFFSRNYFESGSTLSNKTDLLHSDVKTFTIWCRYEGYITAIEEIKKGVPWWSSTDSSDH